MSRLAIRSYDSCNNKKLIKHIYESSFPEEERFPFEILKKCSKENNIRLDAITLNDEIIGMYFTVKYIDNLTNIEITYLMYFAIDDKFRNNGYGAKMIRHLITSADCLLLCIEKPANDIQIHRKNFYLQNGMYETNCIIEDSSVEYEFLCSEKNFKLSDEVLQNRYLKMSSHLHIMRKIKNIFSISINRKS